MESVPSQPPSYGRVDGEPAGASKPGLDTTASTLQHHKVSSNGSPVTSPITSPPYWVSSHQRSFSNISVESVPDGAITLQDNTDDEDSKNKACWAKSVYIEDHVIINGSRTGIGAFVVWNITVETLHVRLLSCILEFWLKKKLIRVVQCGYENDTPSSMTCEINSYKLSLSPKQLCLLSRRKASSPSSARSSWKIEGQGYNTFLSGF